MASFNRVILMGNITRDFELRYTPGGLAVTKIGLAVNDRRKNQAGEWVDETCFVDVTMFGRTAEIANEFLAKGSPIFVEGKLRYETWEKDNQKHSKLSVICEKLQFIGAKDRKPVEAGVSSSSYADTFNDHAEQSESEENIPF